MGMDNENKFYNIYRLCRKEGAWTTRTSSAIYIDHREKRGHGQREQVLQHIYTMEKRGGMDNENKFYNIYRPWRKEGSFLHSLYVL
jgi:hypothetical protein